MPQETQLHYATPPDGYGRYGILDTTDDGLLICHECGHPCRHLATHARLAHGITAADYRAAHGLGISRPLVAEVVSQRMRDAWETHREAHLAALEASRDPESARSASPIGHRGPQGTRRPEVLAGYQARGRARRGRALTPEETATLGDGLDLTAWADAARALLALEGVTATSIAAASGIAVPTVHQRLRRYPAT